MSSPTHTPVVENRTPLAVTTPTWHPYGKPATIDGDNWTEVTYDHAGRRAVVHSCEGGSSCTGAQQWQLYRYDDTGRVLARFDSSGPTPGANAFLAELYVYAGTQLVAFADFNASHPLGAVFWTHTDAQGSLRLVTDDVGVVGRDLSWTPFGAVKSDVGNNAQDGLAYAWQPAPYLHQTITDVGARAREAEYGWFLSPDPVAWGDPADPQSFHRSQYARGNPMTFVDPLGTWVFPASAFMPGPFERSFGALSAYTNAGMRASSTAAAGTIWAIAYYNATKWQGVAAGLESPNNAVMMMMGPAAISAEAGLVAGSASKGADWTLGAALLA